MARWSATHPWRAIGLWVVFVALCFGLSTAFTTKMATDEELGTGESGRAVEILNEGDFPDPAVENLLITAASGTFDPAAAQVAAADATQRLRALPEVASVGDPVPAPNGGALLVPVTMAGDEETSGDRIEPLLDATAAVQRDHANLRVELIGDASIDHGINDQIAKDLQKAEVISLPLTLVILLLAFGAIIAAGVPILLAISAVMAAFGLWAAVSQFVPDPGTASSVILLIGMAVGVDYSLFYLRREREERAKGRGHVDAVEIAAATSGRAVVVSGLAVIISMAGLYIAGDAIFTALATGAIVVVSVAMIGSLTVLPALLAKLGRWVDRPRIPLLWRLTNRPGEPRLWPALLRPALRRPAVTLLLALAAMAALAAPAMAMKLQAPSAETLPREIPVVAGYDRLTAAFPAEGTAHDIAVKAPAARSAQVREALAELARRARQDPRFVADQPVEVRTSTDGTVSELNLATPYPDDSTQAKESLRLLREELVPQTVGAVSGAEVAVGGQVADAVDYADRSRQRLPWVIGFVLLFTFLVMTVTFRSVVIGLTTVAVNLLSTLAAFGTMVLFFQYEWAEGLLGFESTGTLVAWVPMFVFVVLCGLSMDYHVFLVSRIREAVRNGLTTRDAIREGITRSAGVVTSAAVVMVAVFGVFAALSLVEMKSMGVGLSTAILLDAVVIRIVILPALMALLGRANWWGSGLGRQVETGPPEPTREELQLAAR